MLASIPMEDVMLKVTLVCAGLIALAAGPLGAREREATLQKITGPDDTFEMIIGTTKPGNAPIYDLGETPDALVIHLTGSELWVAFDDAAKMLEAVETLHRPLGAFHVRDHDNPVAVYIIPKGRELTALSR
jgi:hypothetical protein